MILGDFAQTLPGALDRIGARAAFAHCDIGSGDADESAARAAMIWPLLAPLLAPGGFVLCDQNLAAAGWTDVALPSGVAPGRYYMYRT